MSVQAGVWNFDGEPADRNLLEKLSVAVAQYGPDGEGKQFNGSMGSLYRPFHTTSESRLERQPHISTGGLVMTWDGRLDNRSELTLELRDVPSVDCTDLSIVAAAYERWGTDCFGKLIGDWALSIWDPAHKTLFLARDFVGIRHLYYYLTQTRVIWCTCLAPLVLQLGVQFTLSNEYIAGYLASYPEAHLTPYREIQGVPPGHFVKIRNTQATAHRYWFLDPAQRIRYRSDAEYEEHFRHTFRRAVKRRLRSASPVLAELSGGIDSSSIICIADQLIAEGRAETTCLHTISYYDDREPNWDERPYFKKVEEKRGKQGCHLDASKQESFSEPIDRRYFSPLPGATSCELEFDLKRIECMKVNGNRVLLSGIGGDEALGGVPNPSPELADLLVQGHLKDFVRQMKTWSLAKKQPWVHILLETLGDFLPPLIAQPFKSNGVAPWLCQHFVKCQPAFSGKLQPRTYSRGTLPSFQAHVNTLVVLQRQLGCSVPSLAGCYETSYPYLDRDFWEFVCSVPRDQILRPGERRALMRRGLVGIVPGEILNRKSKAYVSRGPLAQIESNWPKLQDLCGRMVTSSLGFVDTGRFLEALQKARHGQADNLIQLMKTLKLELWLQGLRDQGILRQSSAIASLSNRSFFPANLANVTRS